MGLKFRGKTTAGSILPGNIEERELHFDFNKNAIFTSTDGTDVVEMGEDRGGTEWSASKKYRPGDFIIVSSIAPSGFTVYEEYIALVENENVDPKDPVASDGVWNIYNVVKWVDQDVNFTVGTGGDFPDLVTCLQRLSKFSTIDGAIVYITIMDGHVIDYPVDIGITLPKIILKYAGAGPLQIVVSDLAPDTFLNIYSMGDTFEVLDIDFEISGTISGTGYFPFVSFGNCHLNGCSIKDNGISTPTPESQRLMSIVNGSFESLHLDSKINDFTNVLYIRSYGFSQALTIEPGTKCATVSSGDAILNAAGGFYGKDIDLSPRADGTKGIIVRLIEHALFHDTDASIGGVESDIDFNVTVGGQMSIFVGCLGGYNITPNTLTANGIIFKS